MTGLSMTVVSAIVRATALPPAERAAAIGEMVPRILRFAAEDAFAVGFRINTLTKAARGVEP